MPITIYDRYGNPKAEVAPNDNATQSKEIQSDNVLSLSFIYYENIPLDVDDYVDFERERYWLCEKYRPKQESSHKWIYDLKLYGIESLIRNILVIKRVDGEEEPVFTLTAPPREHVAMIVNCMNDGMENISWKVGQVDGTENIVIDYFGKYCDVALREIAEKVGAEYWMDGTIVNVCRCVHGDSIALGYDNGLTGIEPDRADNVKFYTRLYPVGSSRNIDPEKYGHSRLQLPGGKKYVEINADKYGRVDHYEKTAFADIYPRRIGEVSSLRSEIKTGKDGKSFTVYYFKDDSMTFDPNDYEIVGLVKRVSFQEGSELAGLGEEEDGTYFFEVNFNSATREFELSTIWPYGNDTQLPGGKLVPKVGDEYILWNLRMPDEYYRLAEEEFMAAIEKYNQEHALDIAVFKASTDHVWIEENDIDLFVGRPVRLESEHYFPETGYRDSRITKITRKINLPSSMDIEIGDVLSRTVRQQVSDDIKNVQSYAEGVGASVASYSEFISNLSKAFVPANSKNETLPWIAIDSATHIRVLKSLYSDGDVGAFGADDSGGSGGESGGGVSYERLDRWSDYDASKAGWVLSAALGADLNSRLTAAEMSLSDFVTSDQLAAKGYLTQASLSDYATMTWVGKQGYLKSSDYASTLDGRYYTETEINSLLNGYVKTAGGSTIAGSLSFRRNGSRYGFYIEALENGSMRVNATTDGQYTKGVFTIDMTTRQFSLFRAYIGESVALDAQSVIYGSPAISDANRIYLTHDKTVWVRYNASLNAIEASHTIVAHGDVTAFAE